MTKTGPTDAGSGPVAASKAPTKQSKPKGGAPKTIPDKILATIRLQKKPSGSSRQAITKHLSDVNSKAVAKALKKMVETNVLEQTGQSYTIPGEVYEVPLSERLQMEEVLEGSGAMAEAGNNVTVAYKGTLDDGYCFDKGDITFELGAGDVIKGWDQGVKGMRVGGKRKLVVPPNLGYGKKGSSPDIPPNAVLHFVVTLNALA